MIYIIDDSVGALIFQKQTGVNGNMIIDNKYYPLALMPNTIKQRTNLYMKNCNGKLVCVNPSISMYLEGAVTGLGEFENDFKNKSGLVLSNKLFADKYNGVDTQLLSNTVSDFTVIPYVTMQLLNEYISSAKVIYIMDSCLHFFRREIEEMCKEKEVHFLFDYILRELGDIRQKKSSYFVSGSRIGFYQGAEELLGGNYVSTRRIKW